MLSRQLINSEIWNKPPEYLKIFLYILLKVNHEDKLHPRGSNFFNFSQEIIPGVSRAQVDHFLRWACSESAKMIAKQKTTRGIILKVNNYDKFQTSENYEFLNELRNELRNNCETGAKQVRNNCETINKNERIKNKEYFYKKEKNFLKNYLPPIIGDFDFG